MDSTFDVVNFNAPWIEGEAATLYDNANYDPGYRTLDGFLEAVPAQLSPGGVVLLQYSDISQARGKESLTHLREAVERCGLEIRDDHSISRRSRVVGGRERVYIFEIYAKT